MLWDGESNKRNGTTERPARMLQILPVTEHAKEASKDAATPIRDRGASKAGRVWLAGTNSSKWKRSFSGTFGEYRG